MNDALPPLLALVLVLSLAAPAVAAADLQGGDRVGSNPAVQDGPAPHVTPIEVDETTNRLPLPDPVVHDYADHGPDLGATLAGTDAALRIEHEQYAAVDREFADATDEERRALLEAAYDRLVEDIRGLEERERRAVREHVEGERTDEELTRALLRNYHEAAALTTVLDELDAQADDVPGYSISSRDVREHSRALEAHQSPIKSELVAASRTGPTVDRYEFLIQTSRDGYRLSTIDGARYLTETTRFDNFDPNAPDTYADPNVSAYDYAGELYPWAQSEGSDNFVEAGSIHDVRFTDDDFDLRIFIDGGTGEVFREYQSLSIDALPVHETWSDDNGDLELSIRATPGDGPVEVTITDAETGDPVVATIGVNGQEVAETDTDGSVWIVPPIGEYNLSAETETDSINATIDISSS